MKTAHNENMGARRTALHLYTQRFSPFIPNISSFLLALLTGILLFREAIIIGPISTIINLGIDEQRARLMATLFMTAAAALVGAAGGKRKPGAILGAGCVFCFSYLMSFIQHELQPAYDPLGNMEPLNSWALIHTAFIMVA
ncbi:MAG: hypothetical protein M3Z24_07595, partial [Chloroflexota bacterium]|nr:hypothetical protein [Chloroflexota bacterium]